MKFSSFYRTFAHDAPNQKVKADQFERATKWFLQNDPRWRDEFKNVYLWDEWPGRYGRDAGIDLVAEMWNGDLVAIQSKLYESSYYIKKADIDSFAHESSRPQFKYRIIVASTNKIGNQARATMEAQEKPIVTILLDDLESSALDWPDSPDHFYPQRPAIKSPRDYQQEAIDDIIRGFKTNSKGQYISPCGSGKTLTALFVKEKLKSKVTLFVAPSLLLVKQTIKEWNDNRSTKFDTIAVCSDKQVANRNDEWDVSTFELGTNKVSTNSKELIKFLKDNPKTNKVVFATYQSLDVVVKAQKSLKTPFDLVVVDEAHRTAGVGRKSLFGLVTDEKAILAKKRLFMTATPRIITKAAKAVAKSQDYEICSMDDHKTYGPVFHEMTFKDAIERNILTDYRVIISTVSLKEVERIIADNEFVTYDDGETQIDARALATQIALMKAMKKYDIKKVISYHTTIDKASKFVKRINTAVSWMPKKDRPSNEIWVDHVSGTMPHKKRDLVIESFIHNDNHAVLSNARCLVEGVDIPAIDGIVFVDPKSSQIDIVQAVGRAMRRKDGKDYGYIFVPVFVDDDADPEAELKSSTYDTIYKVLNALQAHDEVLKEQINDIRRGIVRGTRLATGRMPSRIILDVPISISKAFAKALETKIIEKSSDDWEMFFELLINFSNREGHCRVHQNHQENGYNLGTWVSTQRSVWESMPQYRKDKLLSVPGWTINVFDKAWEKFIQLLTQYVIREGTAKVPIKHIEDGYKLGFRVSQLRKKFNKLPIEKQKQLQNFPGWVTNVFDESWNKAIYELDEYVKVKGDCRVPQDYVSPSGYKLGNWLSKTRENFKIYSEQRQNQLQSYPGWTINPYEDSWENFIILLWKYFERQGNTRVPIRHKEDGFSLGQRLYRARKQFNNLPLDKQQELIKFPDWTLNPTEDTWENWITLIQKYFDREGHAAIPQRHIEDGYKLGSKVSDLRHTFNKLSQQKQQQLLSYPGLINNK